MNKLNHVAIIVDGNGRWAKERGLSRSLGHKEGEKNLEELILHVARNADIKVLSLYVFSTENLKRSRSEVEYLMNLFIKMVGRVKEKYSKENIKVLFSGSRDNFNQKVIEGMDELASFTASNTGLIVNFCLNYGGRREIVDASKRIALDVKSGDLDVGKIDEELFSNYLYNKLPDVDFLIRTSGEMRISNFLLWQLSYAEFYFENTYFPAFTPDKFDKVIEEYYGRDRRFGLIKDN